MPNFEYTHKLNGVEAPYWRCTVPGEIVEHEHCLTESGEISHPLEDLGALFAFDFIGANTGADIIEGMTNVNVAGWRSRFGAVEAEQLTPALQPLFTLPNGPIVIDGDNDSLKIPSKPQFVNTATFIFKIKMDPLTSNNFGRFLDNKLSAPDLYGCHIGMFSTTVNKLHIRGSGGMDYNPDINDVSTGFTVLAILFDGTTCSVYQDDVFIDSGTVEALIASAEDLFLFNSAGGAAFGGDCSHMSAYPTALNTANLTTAYNYISGL